MLLGGGPHRNTDDADNPMRAVYGNEGVPADIETFRPQIGCASRTGSVDRRGVCDPHPEYTARRIGAAGIEELEIVDPDTWQDLPVGVVGRAGNRGPGRFEGYYNDAAAGAERIRRGLPKRRPRPIAMRPGYAYFDGRLVIGCGRRREYWSPPDRAGIAAIP